MKTKTTGPVKGNVKESSVASNNRSNKEFTQNWKLFVKVVRSFIEEIEVIFFSLWQLLIYFWANIFYSSKKRKIHDWVRLHVPDAPDDFNDSWRNGVYLCFLLESLFPGCCPRPDLLDKTHGKKNVRKAVDILQKVFGIVPDITVEEIIDPTAESEKKLVATLEQLKKKAECATENGFDSRTLENDIRLSCTPEVQPCFAKGIGLVIGFVNRLARFSLFFDQHCDVDIVVEIKGPQNTICCERITNRSPKRKKSSVRVMQRPLLSRIGRSMSLLEGAVVEPHEKESPSTEEIRLEYEIQSDKVTVGYIPIHTGYHKVTVLWHGQHISGSPFKIGVEDAFEKLNNANLLKLKPPVQLKGTLKSQYINKNRCSKSKKQSVRFKEADADVKHCCKVKQRKILRYIVNIGGKEMVVDATSSDMLAPALQKLEYELEDNRLVGRRNSWGFAGDVERRKSMVRQFGVNSEDTEYASQRRPSLNLVSNIEVKRILKSQNNEENSEVFTNLKTVTEGTDKGFHVDEGICDVEVDRNWTDELSPTEVTQSPVIGEICNVCNTSPEESSSNKNEPLDSLEENVSIRERFEYNSNDTLLQESLLSEDRKELVSNITSIRVENEDQCTKISESCASDVDSGANESSVLADKEICEKATKDVSQTLSLTEEINGIFSGNEEFKNCNNDVKEHLRVKIIKKRKKDVTSTIKTNSFTNGEGDVHSDYVLNRSRSLSFKIRKKRTCTIKKKKTFFNKALIQKHRLMKLITLSSHQPHGISLDKQALTKRGQKQLKWSEIKYPLPLSSNRKNKKATKTYNKCRRFIKPKVSKNNEKEHESDFLDSFTNNTKILKISYDEDTATDLSRHTYDSAEFENVKDFLNVETKTECSLNRTDSSESNENNRSFIIEPPILRSTYLLQQLEKKQSLFQKSSDRSAKLVRQSAIEIESSDTLDSTEDLQNSSQKPKLTLQPYRERGSSLLELSLPPVKELVRNLEKERQLVDSAKLENNLYSRSLNFPPLAVNVDRKKVKTRIRQWETSSSLPGSVRKNRDAFHQSLDKYKLSVLSDVQTKTVFWENVYQKCASDSRIPNIIEKERWKQSAKSFKATRSEGGMFVEDMQLKTGEIESKNDVESRSITSEDLDCLLGIQNHTTDPATNASSSQHPKRRRHSDPGPFSEEAEKHIKTPSNTPYSKYALSRTNSTSTIDGLSSILMIPSLDTENESYRDEYIDDEIPDYAAMFLDNYADGAGPLFDRRNSYLLRPNAAACKVFGSGICYGKVSTKNHFQVLTKSAGRGNLSVSMLGSSTHDVTYVSVTYIRKDIYDVTYQVLEPGYYLISVRWSDAAVPGSPFVCKVTY